MVILDPVTKKKKVTYYKYVGSLMFGKIRAASMHACVANGNYGNKLKWYTRTPQTLQARC